MVGSHALAHQGCGGLRSEEEEPWEKDSRRCPGNSGWKAKGKAQAEAESGFGQCSMSDPALCPADSTAELQSNGSTKKVVVPGARAPSVKVPGLLNSMPRLLLKHGSKLRSFFASFLSNKPQLRDGATSQRPLWPLPVPYPELFEAGSLPYRSG